MTDTSTRTNDETAARAVLGAIFLSGGSVLDWLELNPADYRQPVHEQIHRAAQTLRDKGQPVDPITVSDLLKKQGLRVDATLPHEVMAETPSAASADYHARIVSQGAAHRRIRDAAARMGAMSDQAADPEVILEEAHAELSRIRPSGNADPVRFFGETLGETIDAMDEKPEYKPTPWPELNSIIGGLRPGALYIVGARPSVGKSVVAMQMATHLSQHGSVAFVSLEMPVSDLHKRAISSYAKVSMSRLEDHTLTNEDRLKISGVVEELDSMPLSVFDRPGATISEIKRFITATHRRTPLAGVFLDYLQLMEPPAGDKRQRQEYIASMARQLKIMAMELHVPVVVLSQLNRKSEDREGKRPQLADLRESGAIEQDADVVLLLHRELEPDTMHEIHIAVAKNRRGRPGSITLDFLGHYSMIR